MKSKITAIITVLMLLLTVGVTSAHHTTTTTIPYCHYWDGHDFDGCHSLTTTSTTVTSTSTTTATSTIEQSHSPNTAGVPDKWGACMFYQQFHPNTTEVTYWNWFTGSEWTLNCLTGQDVNTGKPLG